MEEEQRLIDEFHKNSVEILRTSLVKWKDQDFIDVRTWITSDLPGDKKEQPTKKGIRISVDLLPRLIESLEKAQHVLNEGARRRTESSIER